MGFVPNLDCPLKKKKSGNAWVFGWVAAMTFRNCNSLSVAGFIQESWVMSRCPFGHDFQFNCVCKITRPLKQFFVDCVCNSVCNCLRLHRKCLWLLQLLRTCAFATAPRRSKLNHCDDSFPPVVESWKSSNPHAQTAIPVRLMPQKWTVCCRRGSCKPTVWQLTNLERRLRATHHFLK